MSTLSNGGTTWSTKLRRVRELAEKDRSLVFNNLGHIIDMDFLIDTFQRLDGNKALGIDRISKETYEYELSSNLTELLFRLRRGTYKPRPSRVVNIPKPDGGKRPLAIACLEDKLVQLATARILGEVFEPLFIEESFGYRPAKSGHDAIRVLNKAMMQHSNGVVVEIDLRRYFNSIPHAPLFDFLQKRISDQRFLGLIKQLMRGSTIEEGITRENELGVPQGSILSPILSNVYLHYTLDLWFKEDVRSHIVGQASIVRYADDVVFVFQYRADAERFFTVLPKRLAKYGLELHAEKSQMLASGSHRLKRMQAWGQRLPTFSFLGFTFYWKLSHRGRLVVKVKSRKDRMRDKLKEIKDFLRKNRNHPNHREIIEHVGVIVRGWLAYHAVSDNQGTCRQFIQQTSYLIYKWFNRRGKKGCMNWPKLRKILDACRFPSKWKTIPLYDLAKSPGKQARM